jgi:hypothetical protein
MVNLVSLIVQLLLNLVLRNHQVLWTLGVRTLGQYESDLVTLIVQLLLNLVLRNHQVLWTLGVKTLG